MIITSEKYKAEMAKPFRNQTLIKITHIMEDYANAELGIEEGAITPTPIYYSDYSMLSLIDNIVYNDYAYLAQDSMLLDGTQLVLPDEEPIGDVKNCGFIPNVCSDDTYVDSGNVKGYQYGDENGVIVELQADSEPFDVTGIFILFDEKINVYATRIRLQIVNSDSIELYDNVLDNNSILFQLNTAFYNVDKINITFYSINKPLTYLRITNFNFGTALIYENDDLMADAFTYEKSVDLLSNELSYVELSFNVKNYPLIYNPDDDNNLYKGYDDYQKIKFELGREYDDGTKEYLTVANLLTSGKIELKSNYFTIKAKGILSLYTSTADGSLVQFEKDTWTWANHLDELKTVSDKVFRNSSTIYSGTLIDTNISTKQTDILPVNEIYQLYANHNKNVVQTNRLSQIEFDNTEIPNVTFDDNGLSEVSNIEQTYYDASLASKIYASLQKNAMKMAIYQFLMVLPDNSSSLITNYIETSMIGDINGEFETNPLLTIIHSLPTNISLLYIVFNTIENAYAVDFTVTYYDIDNNVLDRLEITNNDLSTFSQAITAVHCSYYTIEIIKWSQPERAALIMQIGNAFTTGFSLTLYSMFNYPVISSINKPSRISHNYHQYIESEWEEIIPSIIGYKGSNGANGIKIKLLTNQVYSDFSHEVLSGTGDESVIVTKDANKYIFYYDDTSDTMEFKILAKTINDNVYTAYKVYNKSGEVYHLDNPYVTTEEKALEQIDWYYDFIDKGDTMRIDYRGNPELEPLDYIYVDTKNKERISVVITKVKLRYNSGLKGEMEVMKI